MHRVWRKKLLKVWTSWWWVWLPEPWHVLLHLLWYCIAYNQVRELTGGIYFGTPKGIETDPVTGSRKGYSTGVYTDMEIERIAKVALDIAGKRRGKLCSVDKVQTERLLLLLFQGMYLYSNLVSSYFYLYTQANVLDVSQLWREVVISTAKKHNPAIELSHMYIDNCAMQLIRYPKQFDTIVCGNMFGDILSDEASMLVGSLGEFGLMKIWLQSNQSNFLLEYGYRNVAVCFPWWSLRSGSVWALPRLGTRYWYIYF